MEHYRSCRDDSSFTQIDLNGIGVAHDILQCNDCGAVEEIDGGRGPKEVACPAVDVDFATVELRAAAWLNGRFLLADLTSKIPEIVRVVNSGETCGNEFLLGSKPRRYTGYDPAFNGKSFSVPEIPSPKHPQRKWPADFPLIDVNADAIKEVGRTKFFNREYLLAPYQQPKFCAKCGGELTAHPRIGIYCQSCGEQPTLQQVCQHRFMWFGTQGRRRCIDCNAVEEDYLVCQRVGHEWRKQEDGSAVCAQCGGHRA